MKLNNLRLLETGNIEKAKRYAFCLLVESYLQINRYSTMNIQLLAYDYD